MSNVVYGNFPRRILVVQAPPERRPISRMPINWPRAIVWCTLATMVMGFLIFCILVLIIGFVSYPLHTSAGVLILLFLGTSLAIVNSIRERQRCRYEWEEPYSRYEVRSDWPDRPNPPNAA